MQSENEAIEAGLLRPTMRLIGLACLCYLAAVASSAINGLDGNLWINYRRLPIVDSFSLPWSLLHLPVMGFCIAVSALDRSTPRRTNILGGFATFVYFGLDEISPPADALGGLGVYALLVGFLIYAIYFRSCHGRIPSN